MSKSAEGQDRVFLALVDPGILSRTKPLFFSSLRFKLGPEVVPVLLLQQLSDLFTTWNTKFCTNCKVICCLETPVCSEVLYPVADLRYLRALAMFESFSLKTLRFSWQLERIIWLLWEDLSSGKIHCAGVRKLGSLESLLFSRGLRLSSQSMHRSYYD